MWSFVARTIISLSTSPMRGYFEMYKWFNEWNWWWKHRHTNGLFSDLLQNLITNTNANTNTNVNVLLTDDNNATFCQAKTEKKHANIYLKLLFHLPLFCIFNCASSNSGWFVRFVNNSNGGQECTSAILMDSDFSNCDLFCRRIWKNFLSKMKVACVFCFRASFKNVEFWESTALHSYAFFHLHTTKFSRRAKSKEFHQTGISAITYISEAPKLESITTISRVSYRAEQ